MAQYIAQDFGSASGVCDQTSIKWLAIVHGGVQPVNLMLS